MTLLLLFGGGELDLSVPISALVTTAPNATHGYAIDRPATSGAWRFCCELADPQAGNDIVWHDLTQFYVGDRYQRGADDYMGRYRASLATVQLQIDNVQADDLGVHADILAPWGLDTTDLFGVDVALGAGLLMRLSTFRVVDGTTVEWEPIWTGRVESWGDASFARGQTRVHEVSVVDTIGDLANVPVEHPTNADEWPDYFTDVLTGASWLFGVDIYGDPDEGGIVGDESVLAAVNRLDNAADPYGLVWRSLRTGRLVVHPAPFDTQHTERYPNPLLNEYPDGLVFNFSPDFTDIEYIADDDQQPFGITRTVAGVLNSFVINYLDDLFDPAVYAVDDPVSMARYGIRPYSASWVAFAAPFVDQLLTARAFAEAQALPLRTTLDHEGFWSALAIIDHLDPVTIIHATSDTGLVVTASGTVRNVVEERTFRGQGDGVYLLSWQSTVQVDLDAVDSSEALLPVEDLAFTSSTSPGSAGPSSAEFTWTNPTQPSITPTEVQYRVLGKSLIWNPKSYPGVGADGMTVANLLAGHQYTLQVRLIRRVNGVVTNASPIREVEFFTPNRIFPIPVPDGDDTDADIPGDPDGDGDCDLTVELQENDGDPNAWVTVDTFTGSELTDNGDGTFSLTTPIDNSFFNPGSMYRFRSSCDGVTWFTGPEFDPPDDWTDPCATPPMLSVAPYDTAILYVPKVCTGAEDGDPDFEFQGMQIIEAITGIPGVPGDALAEILSLIDDPDQKALLAIDDPDWSDAPGGIVAYGEAPQTTGVVRDKSISCRVNVAQAEDCVLFETAAMRITCTDTTGDWRPGVTIYKLGSTISLAGASILDLDTAYIITATHDYETGDIKLYVDGALDTSVGGTDNVETINALPIWRVGAPPGSWITDCALWDEVITPPAPVIDEPTDIAGCALWLDAADTASITDTAGAVTQWNDKSGNARHVTDQGASSLRPTTGTRTQNGHNVIDFNGSDGLARLAAFWYGLGDSTMFVVYKVDTDPGAPASFLATLVYEQSYAASNPEYGLRYDIDDLNPVLVDDAGSVRFNAFGDDPTDTNPHWATWIDTTTSISIQQDGGTATTASYTRTTITLGVFSVGMMYSNSFPAGGRFMDGWIAEIIIYDHELSSGDIALVEAYIQNKWGL